MPCNCDYMEANNQEIELSKILALLKELKTGKLPSYFGDGYYKEVYNKTDKNILNKKVEELCTKLQSINNIKEYSPEMQIWWREHRKADKIRIEKELKQIKDSKEKELALSKLTEHERKLLGL